MQIKIDSEYLAGDDRRIKMEHFIDKKKGIANRGNLARVKNVMKSAEAGGDFKIAFIGGSITQGSLASNSRHCYAARVFQWWQERFPMSSFSYINAGIGGTTSQFGVARVDEDVLVYKPDLVFVEFSVNDDSTEFFLETYEGLIRKIYCSPTKPAIILIHNVNYDTGGNAQMQHAQIARHYDLPAISMQSVIYPEVVCGNIQKREITPDGLHPNNVGHRLVAQVIRGVLKDIYMMAHIKENDLQNFPKPLTANAYEQSKRLQNYNCKPLCQGFQADKSKQAGITDVYKQGWEASKRGDRIVFEVIGSEIAIQYRKSVKHPAAVAKAVLDGDEENRIMLDGNFEDTWGDCLEIDNILVHGKNGKHTVEIEVIEAEGEDVVPFYLTSLIVSE